MVRKSYTKISYSPPPDDQIFAFRLELFIIISGNITFDCNIFSKTSIVVFTQAFIIMPHFNFDLSKFAQQQVLFKAKCYFIFVEKIIIFRFQYKCSHFVYVLHRLSRLDCSLHTPASFQLNKESRFNYIQHLQTKHMLIVSRFTFFPRHRI